MKREEAKDLFRKDKDAYGKPKSIMHKVDKIFDDFEIEKNELNNLIAEQSRLISEQRQYIGTVKDVLRFCARTDVGTYYQQQSAKKMLLENTHLVWSHCNPDGTFTEEERKWIHDRAEAEKKGGGEKALKKLDEYESELKK